MSLHVAGQAFEYQCFIWKTTVQQVHLMCVVYIPGLILSNNIYGLSCDRSLVSVSMAGLPPARFCVLGHDNFLIYSSRLLMKKICQSACYQLCSWHIHVRWCHQTNTHAVCYQSKQALSSL